MRIENEWCSGKSVVQWGSNRGWTLLSNSFQKNGQQFFPPSSALDFPGSETAGIPSRRHRPNHSRASNVELECFLPTHPILVPHLHSKSLLCY